MWDKRGESFTSYAGVFLSPNELVSQYRCMSLPKTNDNDRTYKNDANILSWHKVNASFWARSLQEQDNCFGMGYYRKKHTRGLNLTYFFVKKPRLFWFFSVMYPWKSQAKQSSTHRNLVKLRMLHSLEISRPKDQDLWKFYMNFSWSPLEIPLCF